MSSNKFTIVLVLSVLSLPALLSMAEPNTTLIVRNAEPDIQTMMTEAENQGLAVVFNTKGRALPLIFNPLSALAVALKPFTVLKLGLMYSASLYLLTVLFPAAFGITGARSARMTMAFDYEYIQEQLSNYTERAAAFLQIPEPDCRYRAVCETATYISTKIPVINEVAKQISGAFFLNLANPYSKAWINGIMQIDCATTYDVCYESPFVSLMNRFVAKKK